MVAENDNDDKESKAEKENIHNNEETYTDYDENKDNNREMDEFM